MLLFSLSRFSFFFLDSFCLSLFKERNIYVSSYNTYIRLLHLSLSHLHLFCSFRLLAFSLVEIGHVSHHHHHRHRSSINHSSAAWLLSACQNIVITTYRERLMINDESSARLYQCEVKSHMLCDRSRSLFMWVSDKWPTDDDDHAHVETIDIQAYICIYICMFYVISKSNDHHHHQSDRQFAMTSRWWSSPLLSQLSAFIIKMTRIIIKDRFFFLNNIDNIIIYDRTKHRFLYLYHIKSIKYLI